MKNNVNEKLLGNVLVVFVGKNLENLKKTEADLRLWVSMLIHIPV